MHPKLTILLLLGCATSVGACGPTEQEVGRAVLMAGPLSMVGAWLVMILLRFLWGKLQPNLVLRHLPIGIGLFVASVLACAALVFDQLDQAALGPDASWANGALDYLGIALMACSATYLTLLLPIWRVWLALNPSGAFSWSSLVPYLLLWWPAVPMALGWTQDWQDFWTCVWVFPGMGGLVAGPLLLIAVGEVLLRLHLRRRATRPPAEPPATT